VLSAKWQIVAVRPAEEVLLVHTLYHPAQRRALLNPEAGDIEVNQQDVRPLLRLIDTTDGEIRWVDYQDDTERRLTELVAAKVMASQNPRVGRSNGRQRAAAGRSSNGKEPAAANGSPGSRRKAA
jgi:non-homologous end joining protein Ku